MVNPFILSGEKLMILLNLGNAALSASSFLYMPSLSILSSRALPDSPKLAPGRLERRPPFKRGHLRTGTLISITIFSWRQ